MTSLSAEQESLLSEMFARREKRPWKVLLIGIFFSPFIAALYIRSWLYALVALFLTPALIYFGLALLASVWEQWQMRNVRLLDFPLVHSHHAPPTALGFNPALWILPLIPLALYAIVVATLLPLTKRRNQAILEELREQFQVQNTARQAV